MYSVAFFKAIWEQNRKLLILALVLLLLCICFFLAGNYYFGPKIVDLRQQRTQWEQRLENQKEEIARSGVPISEAEKITSALRRFSELAPHKSEFSEFIGDLYAWADRSELRIRQIAYQPKVDSESGFLIYSLNFSVQGNYRQLKKFIHLLENSTRILIIDNISLSGRSAKGSDQTEVSLQIQLTTYFQEERQ